MATWPEAKAGHRYADGKWTVGQVVGHMADTERVFAYRLLRIARADATPLAGFDENAWQTAGRLRGAAAGQPGGRARRPCGRRRSRSSASLDDAALDRAGSANDQRVTARALVWLIGGHFAHHAGILRDRYGV